MTSAARTWRKPASEITPFGQLTRSELMSRIRSAGNKTTELRLIRLLRSHHLVGWRRHIKLPGKPDFVWPKARVAVFVHGCFWHGHNCGRNLKPNRNVKFWETRIAGNQCRDRRIRLELQKLSWTVVTIWECRLARSPTVCLRRIASALS